MVLNESELIQEISKIKEEVSQSNLANESNDKYIKMMKSTFQKRFDIGAMRASVVEKIKRLLEEQDLEIATKSGEDLQALEADDWVIFTLSPIPSPIPEWFDELLGRSFESEREVETYFIAPILEELGYSYEDIVIGYPVEIPVGKKIVRAEADFVVFDGPGRDKDKVLLIIEAKRSDKEILHHHNSQAWAYAKELFPARYIITNGNRIIVFGFNGITTPDLILDLNKSMMRENWKNLYRCASKKTTLKAVKIKNSMLSLKNVNG